MMMIKMIILILLMEVNDSVLSLYQHIMVSDCENIIYLLVDIYYYYYLYFLILFVITLNLIRIISFYYYIIINVRNDFLILFHYYILSQLITKSHILLLFCYSFFKNI